MYIVVVDITGKIKKLTNLVVYLLYDSGSFLLNVLDISSDATAMTSL